MKDNELLEFELKKSFDFFWETANTDEESKGFGLIPDTTSNMDRCSIAAVGFGLSAYVIGVERGFISKEEAVKRVAGTLKTVFENVPHYKGFFAHFVYMKDGMKYGKTEYSTIDTSLLVNGMLTCETYFKNEEITKLSKLIYDRVDWIDFVKTKDGKKVFAMSYNPEKDGSYRDGSNSDGYIYSWHMTAEQLMMYFQAAGNDNVSEELALDLYLGFERQVGSYKGRNIVFSPGSSMFIYQFSHAWFPFQKYVDLYGFDWFENSKHAILANRKYCELNEKFPTLTNLIWGLSASYAPNGYLVPGALPSDVRNVPNNDGDGTIAPYAILASVPFIDEEVKQSANYIYEKYPQSFGKYGFVDGINLECNWFSDEYLGLDKGIALLMIDNYLYGTTWKYYEENDIIQKAIKKLRFRNK
jgi:hypothetical protein